MENFLSKFHKVICRLKTRPLIWLFSDVASIGPQQKVIPQDVMLFAVCSFRNHKPACLELWLLPKPLATPSGLTCRPAFSQQQPRPLPSHRATVSKEEPGWHSRSRASRGNCVLSPLRMARFCSPHSLWYVVGDQCTLIESTGEWIGNRGGWMEPLVKCWSQSQSSDQATEAAITPE